MKPDTQKTTKAVREATTASRGRIEVELEDGPPCAACGAIGAHYCTGGQPQGPIYVGVRKSSKPRYTVELTTEGWQIKDNEHGTFLSDVFGSKEAAHFEGAVPLNREHDALDAAEGQGRR